MVITIPASRPVSGPRPINPTRDLPQLTQLLKAVFADELQGDGQQIIQRAANESKPSALWRLDPFLARLAPAYVWEEQGRIVGNVTLLQTRLPGRSIIANVAVQPEFRRRGIARALMEEAQKEAIRRGAREIRLQVERENDAARDLYRSLGYVDLGSTTTWRLSRSYRTTLLGKTTRPGEAVVIHDLPGERWREAYQLDLLAMGADLHWPDPLPKDYYKVGLIRSLANFLSARQQKSWAVLNDRGQLRGLASCYSEWGRAHQLAVRVHPDVRGDLEADLVLRLTDHLRSASRRQAVIVHEADDLAMNEILPAAGFRPERTLAQMQLILKRY